MSTIFLHPNPEVGTFTDVEVDKLKTDHVSLSFKTDGPIVDMFFKDYESLMTFVHTIAHLIPLPEPEESNADPSV